MQTFFWKQCDIPAEFNVVKILGDEVEIMPKTCICDEDQGAGYTYQDEYGDCPFCTGIPIVAKLNEGDLKNIN